MAEQKLFTKEAVETAIKLAAEGTAKVLSGEEARAAIDSLPEELANFVMETTIVALRKAAAKRAKLMAQTLGVIARSLSDEEED